MSCDGYVPDQTKDDAICVKCKEHASKHEPSSIDRRTATLPKKAVTLPSMTFYPPVEAVDFGRN